MQKKRCQFYFVLSFKAISSDDGAIRNGLWTLAGIVIFFLIEKLVPDEDANSIKDNQPPKKSNSKQRHDKKSSMATKKHIAKPKSNKNNRKFRLFESFKVRKKQQRIFPVSFSFVNTFCFFERLSACLIW